MAQTDFPQGVSCRPFGTTGSGEPVFCYRLENPSGAWVELLDYGCTIRSIGVPDRDGTLTDVCLGYDTMPEYESGNGYLGAVIGRCAGRIAGATLHLEGREYPLTGNEGANHLHGGARGFDKHVWRAKYQGGALVFRRRSPDGEEGYPGSLELAVAYTWSDQNVLAMEFLAFSDADTAISLTNHAYFNLAGRGRIDAHVLTIHSDEYVEFGPGTLPTGRILPVEGTALDFRRSRPLDVLLDHCFCLPGTGLRLAALLYCPQNGISMSLDTTQRCLVAYTGEGLDAPCYFPRAGVALEAQDYPDALAHPMFPSTLLRADTPYLHRTELTFSVRV